ncbi:MAG: hypothetical protein RL701_598 [Pseudomonadota bacterium]|jgi:hypothetical protein
MIGVLGLWCSGRNTLVTYAREKPWRARRESLLCPSPAVMADRKRTDPASKTGAVIWLALPLMAASRCW